MSKKETVKKVDKVAAAVAAAAVADPDVLVDPAAKANLWKPKEEGESRTGKFLGLTPMPFGPVLNLETATGLCQIPVSVVLKKVDWEKHVGKNLFFQYAGTVKRYRTFLVKIVK
jgi:hypothetical protein